MTIETGMPPAPLPARVWRSLATAWRRSPQGPAWAPWCWTILFGLLVGLGIGLVSPSLSRADTYLTSVLISLSIHGIFFAMGKALNWDMFALGLPLRVLYALAVSFAGATIGYLAAHLIMTGDPGMAWQQLARGGPVLVGITVFCVIVTYVLLAAVARLRQARADRAAEQLSVSEARREADLARLQLLNAQIEPHFLYNSLAHVDAMIATDPDGARDLLGAMIEYLRLASRNMARDQVRLDEELASVRGFLDVMRFRMGDRLRVSEQIDPAACAVLLPPASMQALVENAIKHGLEPLSQGGLLEIIARVQSGVLELQVRDSGPGLVAATPGRASAGIGLVNLRERLRLNCGARARLSLNSPACGGTIATIRIEPGEPA